MIFSIQFLKKKQHLLFVITGTAVFLIACISVFSFVTVDRMLTNITHKNIATILENSGRGRQLVEVFADINIMTHTFYGRNEYLETQGVKLQRIFEDILTNTAHKSVKGSISDVLTDLGSFVTQAKEVNSILRTRTDLHTMIRNMLENLESLIGNAFINQALEGKDTSYVEQLLMLVVGYQESLLEIGKKFAELGSGGQMNPPSPDDDPITIIDDLTLRLQTITASDPIIAGSGEKILQELNIYRKLLLEYYRELEVLSLQVGALNDSTDQLLAVMSFFDEELSKSMQVLEEKIVKTNFISSAVVPTLAIIIVVAMSIIIIRLFRSMDVQIQVRKQAEKALQESEERFRTLFEQVPTPVHGYGSDGTIHFWNKASETTYGYTKDEALGKNFIELIVPPALRQRLHHIIKTGVDTGSISSSEELLLIRQDGSRVPVFSSFAIVRLSEKEPELYCLDVDMTVQKKLQAQLQQAQKMESIGTLTGGIAHDFNNFLGIIIGNTELALDHIEEWTPVHVNLNEIKAASLKAAGIVKQLLNFSRKTDQHFKTIDSITVIKDALALLRSIIPATIEIRKQIPDMTATIKADPIQINQVLMNLCTNASQAMEETGGILTIALKKLPLTNDLLDTYVELTAGDYVQITISDTGPGIKPDIIGRIFDPYFTTKQIGKGSGMGLAIVHGIVKNHSGSIRVDSQPGAGTTFSVLLPVISGTAVDETEPADEIPGGNETILFIDDEQGIVTMTHKLLERLGYKVEAMLNPIEAVRHFQSDPQMFDLVITDMTMPQMTGVELYEAIRAIRGNVPVIICTGHSSLIDEEKAKNLGVDAFVMKPLDVNEISHTIRTVLDSKIVCDQP